MIKNDNYNFEELKEENRTLKKRLEVFEKEKQKSSRLKFWLAKKTVILFTGVKLKSSILNALNELETTKNISKDTIADLTASIFWRLTRIGIVTLFIALAPTILFFQQNRLIKNQNSLFENQNKRVEQQTYLAEASRRSNQMFIMGEVLSDLNSELENKKNTTRIISNPLVGRILSLSEAMKPYKYLVNDSLIEKPLSPERGQLLISLIESGIDSAFFENRIIRKINSSYADIQYASLERKSLSYLNLNQASLKNIILRFSDLSNAKLKNANLQSANLVSSDLSGSDLSNANLKEAALIGVNLKGAILNHTKFSGNNNITYADSLDYAQVHRKDWLEYIRDSLKIKGAEKLYNKYEIERIYSELSGEYVFMVKRRNN